MYPLVREVKSRITDNQINCYSPLGLCFGWRAVRVLYNSNSMVSQL